ncbi:lipid II flippase MurJ [Helicobacter sp. T3_23-1056]
MLELKKAFFNGGNSSLGSFGNCNLSAGSHCIDFADFESSQAREPSSLPKSAKNSTSTTSPTSIDRKNGEDYLSQDSSKNADFSANSDSSSLKAERSKNTRIVGENGGEDSSDCVIASEQSERGNPLFNNNKIDCHANADAFARNYEIDSTSQNYQNVAEGARGWVKSTLESSPKSSLDSNTESSLRASDSERGTSPQLQSSDLAEREWSQLRKQNPQTTICHTEGAQATEVSQSQLKNRDISGLSPQYDKRIIDKTIDCHAKSSDSAFNTNETSFAESTNNKTKQQSLAIKIKSELKAFFTQFFPAMLGSSTAQIASFIDTILASFLASGSISYLYYANRIFQLPLAIFAIAISTALFPMVAKSIKAGQEANALKSMKKSFWFLCFMLIACAVGGAMLDKHIIWLLYEHGKFSRADTMECALVFAGYMVGLVPFGLARIFSLYLYATMRQALAAKISAISLGVGVGFSLIFMQFWGAFGLALAGSLSGFVLFWLTIKAFGFAKFWGIIADSKLSVFLVAFIGLEVAFLWIFISFVQIP